MEGHTLDKVPSSPAGDTGREVQGPPAPPWLIHGVGHLLQGSWREYKSLRDAAHASHSGVPISKSLLGVTNGASCLSLMPHRSLLPQKAPLSTSPCLSHPGGSSRHRELLDPSHTDLSPHLKILVAPLADGAGGASPQRLL